MALISLLAHIVPPHIYGCFPLKCFFVNKINLQNERNANERISLDAKKLFALIYIGSRLMLYYL